MLAQRAGRQTTSLPGWRRELAPQSPPWIPWMKWSPWLLTMRWQSLDFSRYDSSPLIWDHWLLTFIYFYLFQNKLFSISDVSLNWVAYPDMMWKKSCPLGSSVSLMSCVYRMLTPLMPKSLKKLRKQLTTFPSPWPQTMPLTPSLWPRTASSSSRRCDFLLLSSNLHKLSSETKSFKRIDPKTWQAESFAPQMRHSVKHTSVLSASRRGLPARETRRSRPHSIHSLVLILAWLRYSCPSSSKGTDLNSWLAVIDWIKPVLGVVVRLTLALSRGSWQMLSALR